jgi:hypothetical protein
MIDSMIIRDVELVGDFRAIGADVSGPALRSMILASPSGLDWLRYRHARR